MNARACCPCRPPCLAAALDRQPLHLGDGRLELVAVGAVTAMQAGEPDVGVAADQRPLPVEDVD